MARLVPLGGALSSLFLPLESPVHLFPAQASFRLFSSIRFSYTPVVDGRTVDRPTVSVLRVTADVPIVSERLVLWRMC